MAVHWDCSNSSSMVCILCEFDSSNSKNEMTSPPIVPIYQICIDTVDNGLVNRRFLHGPIYVIVSLIIWRPTKNFADLAHLDIHHNFILNSIRLNGAV